MIKAVASLTLLALATSPVFAKTIAVAAGADAQERLQEALIEAQPGDVVALGAGRFDLTDGLSLDVDRVTVRGVSAEATVLSFKGQLGAGEGLLVTADDVILRDFAVEDSKGDGIKSKDANRIVYHKLRVEWTGGPKETNGAYGIYPVESRHVLIDSVTVKGASDAGIYVGQSQDIIVRDNIVMFNVAGIEIENSRRADVHGNTATRNTGGILVFDLPNLPMMGGRDVRLFGNRITDNDTPNFAPKGNIVANVPTGTGVLVMANRNVHVFDNDLSGNGTSNVMIIAYRADFKDANYDPFPHDIAIGGNRHGRAGFKPAIAGGDVLAAALGGSLPPILWDGAGKDLNIRVTDTVPALSLGLERGSGYDAAKPVPVTFTGGAAFAQPAAVVLPPSMEAAVR